MDRRGPRQPDGTGAMSAGLDVATKTPASVSVGGMIGSSSPPPHSLHLLFLPHPLHPRILRSYSSSPFFSEMIVKVYQKVSLYSNLVCINCM